MLLNCNIELVLILYKTEKIKKLKLLLRSKVYFTNDGMIAIKMLTLVFTYNKLYGTQGKIYVAVGSRGEECANRSGGAKVFDSYIMR